MVLLDLLMKLKPEPSQDELIKNLNRILDRMYPEEEIVENYQSNIAGKSAEGYMVYSVFSGNIYFNDMEYVKQQLPICGIKFNISMSQPSCTPICLENRTISHEYIYLRYLMKTKQMGYIYNTGSDIEGRIISLIVWKC